MKRFFFGMLIFLGSCTVCGSFAFGQNLNDLTDKFYNGLAEVIERNMNNPANCVREVDTYYKNNQALVQTIRSETAKAMQQVAPMMQKYMDAVNTSMTASDFDEAELQALEREMNVQQSRRPPRSSAADRYAKAIEAFTAKHPQHAVKVAMKAMELLPDMQVPSY